MSTVSLHNRRFKRKKVPLYFNEETGEVLLSKDFLNAGTGNTYFICQKHVLDNKKRFFYLDTFVHDLMSSGERYERNFTISCQIKGRNQPLDEMVLTIVFANLIGECPKVGRISKVNIL